MARNVSAPPIPAANALASADSKISSTMSDARSFGVVHWTMRSWVTVRTPAIFAARPAKSGSSDCATATPMPSSDCVSDPPAAATSAERVVGAEVGNECFLEGVAQCDTRHILAQVCHFVWVRRTKRHVQGGPRHFRRYVEGYGWDHANSATCGCARWRKCGSRAAGVNTRVSQLDAGCPVMHHCSQRQFPAGSSPWRSRCNSLSSR